MSKITLELSACELSIISDCLISAISANGKAKGLTMSKAAHDAIDREITVLQNLNTKICGYMPEEG